MKKLILTSLLIAAISSVYAQTFGNIDIKPYVNPNYRYLLLVKQQGPSTIQYGSSMSISNGWYTKDYLFSTFKELEHFLVGGNNYWFIDKKDIIALYDLKTAKKLTPVFSIKHIVTPKQVIIEKEEHDSTLVKIDTTAVNLFVK